MKELRRDVDNGSDTRFHWVVLGPIPELPAWHTQSGETRYPFPTDNAAFRFADNVKATYPDRRVEVHTLDGERFII